MTYEQLAERASAECCDPENTTRYGIQRVRPFWNKESTMFMYVPAFHFTALRGCNRYRYDARDELGNIHSFEASNCCALLTPIWAALPEGVVTLTVTALTDDGKDIAPVGARTFFRSSPFPGKTPPRVCSYKDAAIKAYRYAMEQPFIRHWLEHGTPDPRYDLNSYPAKIISALCNAMIDYASICPEEAQEAMTVAVRAADYMIAITPRGDAALADLPPTYYLDFCPDPDAYGVRTPNWRAATARVGTSMMKYPASAGTAYLNLFDAVKDEKYLREAQKIGTWYAEHVEKNGSWYLVRSTETGEPLDINYIAPMDEVVPFLRSLYTHTGDKCWKSLADGAVQYVVDTQLASYNWEGQFEDSLLSYDYINLTHYGPNALARDLATYRADDPDSMALAKELMRYVEDQFVLWNRPYPWGHPSPGDEPPYDTSRWHTPAALEQYGWYVPIDASTSAVVRGFLAMYKATGDTLYLAKAKALTDQLTRVQQPDGKIPTHWMNTPGAERNFWFNCMFYSCHTLVMMSEYEDIEP